MAEIFRLVSPVILARSAGDAEDRHSEADRPEISCQSVCQVLAATLRSGRAADDDDLYRSPAIPPDEKPTQRSRCSALLSHAFPSISVLWCIVGPRPSRICDSLLGGGRSRPGQRTDGRSESKSSQDSVEPRACEHDSEEIGPGLNDQVERRGAPPRRHRNVLASLVLASRV